MEKSNRDSCTLFCAQPHAATHWSVRTRDGYRELVSFFFFGLVRNWVNTGIPVSFRTSFMYGYCYPYINCFISIHFNVKDELRSCCLSFFFTEWCGHHCACDIHVHVCLRAISGGKSEKVWAHVIKLSYTSVRCNICSSVIVNKGGNTSNIVKHLLTKHNMQCAVLAYYVSRLQLL